MKVFNELIKIILLLVIVVLLGIGTGIFQKPSSTETSLNSVSDEQPAIRQNPREEDLRRIMEHSLASLFKFPESVRLQNTKFEYKRLLHDVGIEVDTSKEFELATLCGHYSAQNAMGVYGAFEPFYVEVAVDNEKQSIYGELWFINDGKVQKLLSLDSKITLDGDKEEFQKRYSKNCGEMDNAYMGAFSSYEIGYDAMPVKYYAQELDNLSKYPDLAETLQKCVQAGASFDYCLSIEHCQRAEISEGNWKELCSKINKICSDEDSPADCEAKITAAFKEKGSKKE